MLFSRYTRRPAGRFDYAHLKMATAFDAIGGLPIFRKIVIGDDCLHIADIGRLAASCSSLRSWCRDIVAPSRLGILMLARATADQLGRVRPVHFELRFGNVLSCAANLRFPKQPALTDDGLDAVLDNAALTGQIGDDDDNCAFYVHRDAASLVFIKYNHWFNHAAQRERLPRTSDGRVDHDLIELTEICLAARRRRAQYTDTDYGMLASDNEYASNDELASKCERYNESRMCACCCVKLGECGHDENGFDDDELLSFRAMRRGERRRSWDADFFETLHKLSMRQLIRVVDQLREKWTSHLTGDRIIADVKQIHDVAFRIQQQQPVVAKRPSDDTLHSGEHSKRSKA